MNFLICCRQYFQLRMVLNHGFVINKKIEKAFEQVILKEGDKLPNNLIAWCLHDLYSISKLKESNTSSFIHKMGWNLLLCKFSIFPPKFLYSYKHFCQNDFTHSFRRKLHGFIPFKNISFHRKPTHELHLPPVLLQFVPKQTKPNNLQHKLI